MHPMIDEADVALLRLQGMVEKDVAHSVAVAELALDIAARLSVPLDLTLVARGALLHDLGKVKASGMEHGRAGAEIGTALGLPAELCSIMEKHIWGGLSEAEAREFGLPSKDYSLNKLEERIIAYADKLVDIVTKDAMCKGDPHAAVKYFEDFLEADAQFGKNELTMRRYCAYHQEIQGLIRAGAV